MNHLPARVDQRDVPFAELVIRKRFGQALKRLLVIDIGGDVHPVFSLSGSPLVMNNGTQFSAAISGVIATA